MIGRRSSDRFSGGELRFCRLFGFCRVFGVGFLSCSAVFCLFAFRYLAKAEGCCKFAFVAGNLGWIEGIENRSL